MSELNPPSVANGLAAALLLARGREVGLALVPSGMEGARHSFLAALICLPVLLIIRLYGWSTQAVPPNGEAVALAAELVGYSLGWVGFALASLMLAQRAQRGADWPRFIAAWNWTSLVQYALLLVLLVPSLLGLPTWVSNALGLVAVGYAIWLEWFVTRVALNLPGPVAALFVIMDLAIGLFVGGLTDKISGL
ncbi:hypothetical protein [Roseococcus pinisoli]|uniref:Yip1 domain-containing protein n=1 Tax=Roseococcus pinisoli TaxID=2835040 RepID=A0ABS5QBQ1_9PROT|nr:hypothetical protein [Roseococcus pinisoli]MBS7811125.1 hypothetical protein [Roseococcus pinisoli]